MILNIIPFLTYVRSEYLYKLTEGHGYSSPATVFAISLSPNETIKLNILADDTTMFSNIPVCALMNSKAAREVPEDAAVFDVCPDGSAEVIQYEYLTAVEHCGVWKKDRSFWQKGVYLFSVEWQNKEQSHFIELEDGNYVFWNNRHITWGEETPTELPAYGAE
jgi:hypothetical protein